MGDPTSSPSFCVLPWLHMNLNPDGKVTLCCQSHQPIVGADGRELNAQTHSLEEIWNSTGMREIRQKISEGDQLKHCDACFNAERYGRKSHRMHHNEHWLAKKPELAAEIESRPDHSAANPIYFDLRLGNLCNLKCTACKPLYSSQIERDATHSPWITDAPYARLKHRFGDGEWSEKRELLDEVIGLSDRASTIQLAGGEPTINRTQMGWIEHLRDTGRAGDIDLELVTNLVNVRPALFEVFSAFRSLKVALSIDGIGAGYEYVRYPGKWPTVAKNVAKLRAIRPDAHVSINAVLQAINAFNVIDLLDWADTEDIPIGVSIGRGLDHYNDYRILPPAVRKRVQERVDEYLARKGNQPLAAVRRAELDPMFRELEDTDFDEETRRKHIVGFMQFINDMDTSRGLSFRSVAPEIYEGVAAYHGDWDSNTRFATKATAAVPG